jgi:hypothetical protein
MGFGLGYAANSFVQKASPPPVRPVTMAPPSPASTPGQSDYKRGWVAFVKEGGLKHVAVSDKCRSAPETCDPLGPDFSETQRVAIMLAGTKRLDAKTKCTGPHELKGHPSLDEAAELEGFERCVDRGVMGDQPTAAQLHEADQGALLGLFGGWLFAAMAPHDPGPPR